MTVIEAVQEEARFMGVFISREEADAIAWCHTGFPAFWNIPRDGNTGEECMRKQVREFFGNWRSSGIDPAGSVTTADAAVATKEPAAAALRTQLDEAVGLLRRFAAIGEALATQDNRITANPVFVVQRSRRTYGFDPNYTEDSIAWIDTECVEVSADEYEALEAKWEESGDEPDGYTRTAYVDTWEYVMPFFTERAAQRYIDENGHNHGGKEHLRIYVESGYRNHEWSEIRAACVATRAFLATHDAAKGAR